MRGSDHRGPLSRLRGAIVARDLAAVRDIAGELQRVPLRDALAIAELVVAEDAQRLDAAGARWLGRLFLEQPGVTLAHARRAAAAMDALPERPEGAMTTLRALCDELRVP